MSWDDFSSPGWADRDGDGHISFGEGMEEYFAYHAIMDEDSCDGYNSNFDDDDDDDDDFDDDDDDFDDGDDEYYFNGGGNFGRRYTFEGSGAKYERTDYTAPYNSPKKNNIPPSAALDLKEAFIPPKKHIPSLWDDRWELASLLLRIAYLAALVLLCYHQFGETGGFPEFIEIMVYILVISIFGAIGFFAFFVWRSVCKEKDPYPNYFDNLAEKPETLYPRPASIKIWLLFLIVSFIAIRIGFHPENIQKTFMLTDSAAVAFSVAGLLTPAFLVLIYKVFTTVKRIGVKKELMKDLEKRKSRRL